MTTIYFDRNVFAEICEFRNNFTQDDFDIIKKAVDSKHISIPLSSALLAETTAILQKSNDEFLKHLKTVFSLISRERMVKQTDILLRDDCVSFAHLTPFQRTAKLSEEGRKFINSPKINSSFLKVALNHPQAMREATKHINVAISSFRQNLEKAGLKNPINFSDFWKKHSMNQVEKLVNEIPDTEKMLCKKWGIEKMLQIKSIRLYTVYQTWILYSGLYGIQGNPRILKSNDVMDSIHAIESSAAEIFVTQENKTKANRLPFILNQVTYDNYKIMNLKEFLNYLKNTKSNN